MSTELYLRVLYDGVLSSFLIPFHSQTTYFAMRAFGGQDDTTLYTATAAAIAGGVIGHSINWVLGNGVMRFIRAQNIAFWTESYPKIQPYFNRYGIYTLLLSWMPLFSVFSFASGLFAAPYRKYVFPFLLISQSAYYLHHMTH